MLEHGRGARSRFAAFAVPPVLGLYGAASAATNAYDLAQDPCSSNWAIAGQSASAVLNVAGILGFEPSLGDSVSLGSAADEGAAEFAVIGGPRNFDPESLKGLTPSDVEAKIPADWVKTTSKTGGGEVFSDPANLGRQIRIMPGYGVGARSDPITEGPYAVVSQNGVITKVPLAGNPTLR